MATHLIIGINSLVGRALYNALRPHHDIRVVGWGKQQVDITDRKAVHKAICDLQPDVIYLAAAKTDVDSCQVNVGNSYDVNVNGVRNVVDTGYRTVFFSTDYVFDGKKGPYSVDALPCPINIYGRHKLEAEGLVLEFDRNCVVRTTQVFGSTRGFVVDVVRQLSNNGRVMAASDQYGTPTYAADLANATVNLVLTSAQGIVNVVGPEWVSRLELACKIAKAWHLPTKNINGVLTSALGQAARRPLKGGLINSGMLMRTLDSAFECMKAGDF